MVNGEDDLSAFRILLDCGVWRNGGLCVGMAIAPLQPESYILVTRFPEAGVTSAAGPA